MNTLAPYFLIGSSSFLQVTRTYMKAWTSSSNFNLIPPPTPELSALARLKNCCEHSSAYIFIGSSFFQVMRTTIKLGHSLNFGQIRPRDAELQPLINVRNWFLLKILRMDGQNLTKFCIHMIISKIYISIVKHHFSQVFNRVTALN